MKEIVAFGGHIVIVDDEDYELFSRYKWHLTNGYAIRHRNENGKHVGWHLMHRDIMHANTEQQIDHINHNKLDNRKENLRFATVRQNGCNQLPQTGCSSKYKGVCWSKWANKWQAQIKNKGRRIYLGLYDTEERAAQAYNLAAKNFFGEYAYLNRGMQL